MTQLRFVNFFDEPLEQPLGAQESELVLSQAVIGRLPFVDVASEQTFKLTLYDGVRPPEIVLVQIKAPDGRLMVNRGSEGSSPQDWPAGTRARNGITAQTLNEVAYLAPAGVALGAVIEQVDLLEQQIADFETGGGGILEAPQDGKFYARKDGQWVEIEPGPVLPVLLVTVADATSQSLSPPLVGTVNSPIASVVVSISGQDYPAVNNGDGTWSLAAGTITSLAYGAYTTIVLAETLAGDSDIDTGMLTIVSTLAVTINSLVTNDSTPVISGTVSSPSATISVEVTGQLAVTLSDVQTNDLTPTISGTVNSPVANITVEVTPV